MDDQQQILAMILNAKAAGKSEDEIVEMLRATRDARNQQDSPDLETPPNPAATEDNPIDGQADENSNDKDERIDEQGEDIEWIFTDDDVPDKSGQGPKETQSSSLPQTSNWEIVGNGPNTIETAVESAVNRFREVAIADASPLAEKSIKPKRTRKPYHQSPLSILSSFIFLGAVVGVTVYQFFRLHPRAPDTPQETRVVSPESIGPAPPLGVTDETPAPSTVAPSPIPLPSPTTQISSALPTGCGLFDGTREAHIEALKTSRFVLGGSFPGICLTQLDELQFKYAIEKLAANDANFQAAATLMCQVTESYFKSAQDPFSRPFFRDWAENDNQFKTWLEKYLAKNDCPAANYLQ